MNSTKFFYAYNKQLIKYLRYDHVPNIEWNCKGLHPRSQMMFWQFTRTPELEAALTEFSKKSE
ncbi:hypothetical protein [Saccharibacillus endophyticus]|uniref:Uncharacterized protein n=1 Tax=Saccharibacillus endophyticus TaxID=2060666 RepID=A0ABQ2A0D8_9BACL|nr:hypothetical protein [Saccharibacillus endophyticus]GGH81800.1 hypothetical protein GCM10007362_32150 [Saccharibacillus endophyticus]